MHYFQFHIGDYRSSTAHLTNEEDLAYRRLLDMYYDLEGQIPLDTEWVSRRIRVDASIVRDVLNDMFERTEDGYRNERCDKEIAKYQALAERNRSNGSRGGRPKQNPVGSESQPTGKLTTNQEPETNNHKPKVVRGTRLDPLYPFPPEWSEFCKEKRPDLVPREVFESFRDYWIAKPGQAGVKLDWDATWRNWVRSQKNQNFKSQTQLTVPSRPERDPALVKLDEDRKKREQIPLEIRQQLQTILRRPA